MVIRSFISVLCLVLIFASRCGGQSQKDFSQLAEKFAPQVVEKLKSKLPSGVNSRVVVFPPGDSDGKVTPHIAEPSMVLQGELIVSLQKQFASLATPKCFVLTKAGISRVFKDAALDPSSMNPGNPQETASALKKLKIDVAVLVSIDAKSAAQLASQSIANINISLTIVTQDGSTESMGGSVEANPTPDAGNPGDNSSDVLPPPVPPIAFDTCGRFAVEIFAAFDDFQKPLQIVSSKNPNSEYHKVYFLGLPKEIRDAVRAGDHRKSEYKIRISNRAKQLAPATPMYAKPGVNEEPSVLRPSGGDDKHRLFGVAVLVDGVSSFYEKDGTGQVGPVVRLPSKVSKWILTGPGDLVVADPSKPGGYKLEPAGNKIGHSVVDIAGFQKDGSTAEAFEFASASDSIAEAVGITNDVGLIAVHFYAEDLNDIITLMPPDATPGTRAGRPIDQPIFRINPKLRKNPSEVWRIFYRFEDEIPIPPSERVEVAYLTGN